MGININRFRTIIFDCDGVILDSNKVKSSAFYEVALVYGEEAANALVKYNSENGGISRFKKFEHFLKSIVPTGTSGPGLDELVSNNLAHINNGYLELNQIGKLYIDQIQSYFER